MLQVISDRLTFILLGMDLKSNTLNIRIAGIDAPEVPHDFCTTDHDSNFCAYPRAFRLVKMGMSGSHLPWRLKINLRSLLRVKLLN